MARLTGTAPKRVGLILGREWSFPPALIEEVAKRDEGVTVEYARIGATHMDQPCPYDVVIDRISHEVPFYRTWLKKALLDAKHEYEMEIGGGRVLQEAVAAAHEPPAPQPAPTPPSASRTSLTADEVDASLSRLADMRDRGLVTQAEFDEKKRELLDRL